MDVKKEAARVASELVKDHESVGLGDGSTVRLLAEYLIARINGGLKIRLFTSSLQTRDFLLAAGFVVNDISDTDTLDIYFDGCDQIDNRLNALKSGSGIHTMEKLLASMAKNFVIMGDRSKFVQKFDPKFPLVLEILPQALAFVQKILLSLYPDCALVVRSTAENNENRVLTRNGNYLIDCRFPEWPELENLQLECKKITGVVEISLFYQIVDQAIIADNNGVKRYLPTFATGSDRKFQKDESL